MTLQVPSTAIFLSVYHHQTGSKGMKGKKSTETKLTEEKAFQFIE
jgi:hypothetical protein